MKYNPNSSRVPYPDLAKATPETAQLVNILNVNLFKMMAHAPELVKPMVYLGGTLRFDGVVDRAICEVAILRVGYLSDAVYETQSHERIALEQGVDKAQFDAIRKGPNAAALLPAYRTVLAFVDDMVQNVRACDETLQPMIDAYGIAGTQQLVILIGFYMTICRFSETFDVTRDAAEIDTPSAVTMGRDAWGKILGLMFGSR